MWLLPRRYRGTSRIGAGRGRRVAVAGAVVAGLAVPAALMTGTPPTQAAVERPTAVGPTAGPAGAPAGGHAGSGADEDAGTKKVPDTDELPHPLAGVRRGERAIRALGPHIGAAASRNGMSVRGLTRLLRQDRSVRVDTRGDVFFIDSFDQAADAEAAASSAISARALPYPSAKTFALHSKPGSRRTTSPRLHRRQGLSRNRLEPSWGWHVADARLQRRRDPVDVHRTRARRDPGGVAAGERGLRPVRGRRDDSRPRPRGPSSQLPERRALRRSGADHAVAGGS